MFMDFCRKCLKFQLNGDMTLENIFSIQRTLRKQKQIIQFSSRVSSKKTKFFPIENLEFL